MNAARWDLKASLLEYAMADVNAVWPDRFGVDIKSTPFIANIFRRLIAICNKRSAVPIGGMATTLPHRNQNGKTKSTMINSLPMIRFSHKKTGAGASLLG